MDRANQAPEDQGNPVAHTSDLASAELATQVARAQSGDRSAFATLFLQFNARICTYLARLVGDNDIGRDLAQDTFVTVWRALPEMRDTTRFVPWLYRIATNTARLPPAARADRALAAVEPSFLAGCQTSLGLTMSGPEQHAGESELVVRSVAPPARATTSYVSALASRRWLLSARDRRHAGYQREGGKRRYVPRGVSNFAASTAGSSATLFSRPAPDVSRPVDGQESRHERRDEQKSTWLHPTMRALVILSARGPPSDLTAAAFCAALDRHVATCSQLAPSSARSITAWMPSFGVCRRRQALPSCRRGWCASGRQPTRSLWRRSTGHRTGCIAAAHLGVRRIAHRRLDPRHAGGGSSPG